ncbi:MAG: DUF2231 domain-containing protein [Methylococcaceae bacterium]|jgi:uncharacterized membrane protein|nr:DUF2231 domain-containing protein [Methylococcaceae bacterium]
MATYFTDFGGIGPGDFLPAVHAGHGESGGLVGWVDHLLATLTSDTPRAWNLLGGIEVMGENIHPLLVHFPIAFLTGFLLVEWFGLVFKRLGARQLASGLLYLGAASAVLTAIFGLIAAESVPHGALVHEIMEWHMRAGLTVASLSVVLAIWRAIGGIPTSTMTQVLSLLVTVIMAVVLFLGADLGGMMVYKHGVGVQSLQEQSQEGHQHHHLHGGAE